MNFISSRTNHIVKQVAELSSSDVRSARRLFIAEGLRTCSTLCESGLKLQQLFVTQSLVAQAHELVDDHLITQVTDPVMEKISQATKPSGMLAVFHMPTPPVTIPGAGIVLAQVREPGNVGTLIRSCAAFGMKSVILVESADVWSPKVVQATAGALGAVSLFVISWQELLERKGQLKLCALTVEGGNNPSNLDLGESLLVIGNEGHGIPESWIGDCQQRMTLPMPGGTESLNAAVAGSIGLYEMAKVVAR